MWNCAAIDHGVTIFPNGKIGPCCQIDSKYLKPISELDNPSRFADLKTQTAPAACNSCSRNEAINLFSYRQMFNNINTGAPGLQFVDIRNTNLCNLKCRYCGPHFSSQWAEEFKHKHTIIHQSCKEYLDVLITESLHWMYFTGGEPLIIKEHWELLEKLIQQNKASTISLLYNTNLTTITYKDKNIIDLWKKFKNVKIQCSIDAVGEPMENIRSGASWAKIKSNFEELVEATQNSNIVVTITPVLNILNIWFINDLYSYAKKFNTEINLYILDGPNYLSLDVIPDSLKGLAIKEIELLTKNHTTDKDLIRHMTDKIINNKNQHLFQQTLTHILLLDKLRNEKLFDLLPFKQFAIDTILKNHEYE